MILRGRRVVPGRAEGQVLLHRRPLSFLGGLDPASGRITDAESDRRGEATAGRVLAFPHGVGSTVGSYVLYGAAKRGVGPVALVVERAETIVVAGAVLASIPVVDGIDLRAVAEGDVAVVDGDAGTVALRDVKERRVVTAFLRRDGRILVLRRSQRVGTYRGRWAGVSGSLEGDEEPEDRARAEIAEETGLDVSRLVARGPVLPVRDGDLLWSVHPFLFDVAGEPTLDWEHTEARWVPPQGIEELDTVPGLADALRAVLPRTRAKS
jgi:predicted aconitase with swiveling domain/8-oxo-dGTP pyrophosphatase MutT (NUDIX family)